MERNDRPDTEVAHAIKPSAALKAHRNRKTRSLAEAGEGGIAGGAHSADFPTRAQRTKEPAQYCAPAKPLLDRRPDDNEEARNDA